MNTTKAFQIKNVYYHGFVGWVFLIFVWILNALISFISKNTKLKKSCLWFIEKKTKRHLGFFFVSFLWDQNM